MKSIFAPYLSNSDFWNTTETPRPAPVSCQGVLLSEGQSSQFLLSNHTFYHCTSLEPEAACDRTASLDWVKLSAFEEPTPQGTQYGFTLQSTNFTMDFYTATQEELGLWMDHLETCCVLTDLEEDYSVVRKIGAGGQALVYLGESLVSGRQVAIKSFTKLELKREPKRLDSLVKEVSLLRKLSHPCIVRLYQVYEDRDAVSLVFEYIPGEELYQSLLHQGRFTPSESRLFALNFLDLLSYLQANHILHRDLKPENIMLPDPSNRSNFKLIDFGFAVEYTGQVMEDSCGSPGYLAPELLIDRRHGPTVDVYSAGVIIYVVACGCSPFFAKTRKEVLKLNIAGEIRFHRRRPEEQLVQLILSMTAFDPLQRGSIAHLQTLLIDKIPLTHDNFLSL